MDEIHLFASFSNERIISRNEDIAKSTIKLKHSISLTTKFISQNYFTYLVDKKVPAGKLSNFDENYRGIFCFDIKQQDGNV